MGSHHHLVPVVEQALVGLGLGGPDGDEGAGCLQSGQLLLGLGVGLRRQRAHEAQIIIAGARALRWGRGRAIPVQGG